ncbi:hypothetical protein, partial [Anaerotignum lactatifermentans]|uniref:hypothetical protein n=1 Tax=Anaerotignum lactatifermentans TaxID=160404 RepID=UPI00307972D4
VLAYHQCDFEDDGKQVHDVHGQNGLLRKEVLKSPANQWREIFYGKNIHGFLRIWRGKLGCSPSFSVL